MLFLKCDDNFNILCKYLDTKKEYFTYKDLPIIISLVCTVQNCEILYKTGLWIYIEEICYWSLEFRKYRLSLSFTEKETERFLYFTSKLGGDINDIADENWSNLIITPDMITKYDRDTNSKIWENFKDKLKLTPGQYCTIINTFSARLTKCE
jgi:hypothetical protein